MNEVVEHGGTGFLSPASPRSSVRARTSARSNPIAGRSPKPSRACATRTCAPACGRARSEARGALLEPDRRSAGGAPGNPGVTGACGATARSFASSSSPIQPRRSSSRSLGPRTFRPSLLHGSAFRSSRELPIEMREGAMIEYGFASTASRCAGAPRSLCGTHRTGSSTWRSGVPSRCGTTPMSSRGPRAAPSPATRPLPRRFRPIGRAAHGSLVGRTLRPSSTSGAKPSAADHAVV